MKTLLRIDASARSQGSHTRELADTFQRRWQELNPDGKILRRDLAAEPVPHLSDEAIKAFQQPVAAGTETTLSDLLARELVTADHLLIASPIYNLSLPSSLKAYIDHVVRSGISFQMGKEGHRGLLAGTATLITARGGQGSAGDQGDLQTGYVRAILAFMGITLKDVITADGMALGAEAQKQGLARARRQLDHCFAEAPHPQWRGSFDEHDKQQIAHLRQAQTAAIVAGDAEAYAELCTGDIQLMIPGKDLISGRQSFLDAERELFAQAAFNSFEKQPLQVDVQGELAVEIGRQQATTHGPNRLGGVYSARQKYTHVLRRTAAGWRFAVLMSNPCE